MGMIFVREKAGKTKRKPGWQKAEAEYQAWLAKVNGVKLFDNKPKAKPAKVVKVDPVVRQPYVDPSRTVKAGKSLIELGTATVPVKTPERLYRDNPEMLERERIARQRKFNVAPAYNKGGAQFVSEDELVSTLSTNKRR
jgi:hypothetical protein